MNVNISDLGLTLPLRLGFINLWYYIHHNLMVLVYVAIRINYIIVLSPQKGLYGD